MPAACKGEILALRDRWLGRSDTLDAVGCQRRLRLGGPRARIHAARRLAALGEVELLVPLLSDAVPGVRRAAARGLGWVGEAELEPLLARTCASERTLTVSTALRAARIRCGAPPDPVFAEAVVPRVGTAFGPRTLAVDGTPDPRRALRIELGDRGDGPRTRDRILREDAAALAVDPHDRDRWATLGSAVPDALPEPLPGRRSGHAWLEAVGLRGDPDSSSTFTDTLTAMDRDPGRGFTQRRLAGVGLGQLGDPGAVRPLRQALEREALEYEGRPGAGLGVQFPVRGVLLWALGELQAHGTVPLLVSYLGLVRGSATGGLHLPAMAALWSVGPPAVAALRDALAAPEESAANAAGLLRSLRDDEGIRRALADRRARVRAAAEALD